MMTFFTPKSLHIHRHILNICKQSSIDASLLQRRIFVCNHIKSSPKNEVQSSVSSEKYTVRIVFISDTHAEHEKHGILPCGDILIHAGDFSKMKPPKAEEYKKFVDWFSSQPHNHKILISGNRDNFMDTQTTMKHDIKAGFWMNQMQKYVKETNNIKYLEDNQHVIDINFDNEDENKKIHIYGTPWTGLFGKPGKAFQIPRQDLSEKWGKIPSVTDILISHMPPFGILDKNAAGMKAGCPNLLKSVTERVKPRIHVFGHIHESYGHMFHDGVLFINAASLKKSKSNSLNPPIVVDYCLKTCHLEII